MKSVQTAAPGAIRVVDIDRPVPGRDDVLVRIRACGIQEWLTGAQTHPGSWWPDFVGWLDERGGGQNPAPEQLGGGGLVDAPGTYVFDR